MRGSVFLLLLVFMAFSITPSIAGTMKAYNYPELSMEAPSSLDVKESAFKDAFPVHGCCYIKQKANK